MNGKSKSPGFLVSGIHSAPALIIALAVAIVYIILAADRPADALRAFFLSPFANLTVFLNLLEQTAVPCLCALGAALVFRSGDFNLGGEGQAYAGGVAAVLALLASAGLPSPLALPIGLACGTISGALVSLPSALSRRYVGADVLLSTFLVSQAVTLALDWALAGPLRDPASNLMATPSIPRQFSLPRFFPPASVGPSFFLAIVFSAGLDLFFRNTRRGMELTLFGKNPVFARSIGFSVAGYAFWPLLASGAFHGLAGALLAVGGNGRAVRGMTGGVGWNGISIALIAGNDPRWILPAAFLFSWLDTGARQASILAGLSIDVSAVTKALVLLFATARFVRGSQKRGSV